MGDGGDGGVVFGLEAPSRAHLLGTDELGRDTFSRLLWGSRASIQAGVFATLLATLIAVPIGLAAGYYRGWIDPVIALSEPRAPARVSTTSRAILPRTTCPKAVRRSLCASWPSSRV